jgi:hypothetical protein
MKWLMLLVLQALSAAPSYLHSIGHFVESIHHELGPFQFASFAHCQRDANGVAHSLAQEVASRCLDTKSVEFPPSLICTQLFRELCNS